MCNICKRDAFRRACRRRGLKIPSQAQFDKVFPIPSQWCSNVLVGNHYIVIKPDKDLIDPH
jgi:hypothetical protein